MPNCQSGGRVTTAEALSETGWLDDPTNPQKIPDGFGGLNSLFIV